ncbi:hypothetical protein AX15_005239 [Amanita polypyramis BW_CC]|nr:hypothetical protein AX15_005239 [Amanita polypyramis BW_CC]
MIVVGVAHIWQDERGELTGMSANPPTPSLPEHPKLDFTFVLSSLPVSQLESLRFKANQIIESIQNLQQTLDAAAHFGVMPQWPDILSKYNILLSQTHSFSTSLVSPLPSANINGAHSRRPGGNSSSNQINPYERIALHPNDALSDVQLDTEVIPLLRNQQTTDVLRMEHETVRRLAEHMTTRGSVGVLGPPPAASQRTRFGNGFGMGSAPKKPEYEEVLRECEEIRAAHDKRSERAVRAVLLLRDKFDWKQRVEVEVEEPEELTWDPRLGPQQTNEDGMLENGEEGSSDEEEVNNVEGALVDAGGMEGITPDATLGPS